MKWQKTLEALARSQKMTVKEMMNSADTARKLGIPNYVLQAYYRSMKTGRPLN